MTIQLRLWVSMGEISQMRVLQYRYYISWIHLKKVQPTCKFWGKDHFGYTKFLVEGLHFLNTNLF